MSSVPNLAVYDLSGGAALWSKCSHRSDLGCRTRLRERSRFSPHRWYERSCRVDGGARNKKDIQEIGCALLFDLTTAAEFRGGFATGRGPSSDVSCSGESPQIQKHMSSGLVVLEIMSGIDDSKEAVGQKEGWDPRCRSRGFGFNETVFQEHNDSRRLLRFTQEPDFR